MLIWKRSLSERWSVLNKMLKAFLTLFIVLFWIPSYGVTQEVEIPTLCETEPDVINDELMLDTEISEAIAREDKLLALSYMSIIQLETGAGQRARKRALNRAFRTLIRKAVEQMVPEERLSEVGDLTESKIYRRARYFIRTFRTLKEERCLNDYRLPVELTLKLVDLRQALLKHNILEVAYVNKEIRLLNVKGAKSYRDMKKYLKDRLRNVRRIVEHYQRKGEIHFLVETALSLDQMIARISPLGEPEEGQLRYRVEKGERGGIEITFLD